MPGAGAVHHIMNGQARRNMISAKRMTAALAISPK
jgi:hypothetical protein